LTGTIPQLNVSAILLALIANVQTSAVTNANDPVIVTAHRLQSPSLLAIAVPGSLSDVGAVIIIVILSCQRFAALPTDDGDFAIAKIYDIPILIRLIGVTPLLDISPIQHALRGNINCFIAMPAYDRTRVIDTSVWPAGITVATDAITPAIATVVAVSISIAANLEIGAAAAIYPDTGAVEAPGSSFDTSRATPLRHQANDAGVSINRASVAPTIIGGAIDALPPVASLIAGVC
jgi:hypothetical protein